MCPPPEDPKTTTIGNMKGVIGFLSAATIGLLIATIALAVDKEKLAKSDDTRRPTLRQSDIYPVRKMLGHQGSRDPWMSAEYTFRAPGIKPENVDPRIQAGHRQNIALFELRDRLDR